jgi:N-acetylglucosaminyldiphosphoundecaprenol N-acetyl-beta-D-mannosaminyltransferase
MNFVDVMGYRVYNDSLNNVFENNELTVINTMGPISYGIATKDALFMAALKSSDYLVLDGVYFGLASILLSKVVIKKNNGPSVFYHFMQKMDQEKGRVFFLGSNNSTLNKIIERAKSDYPNIEIKTYSPPYKKEFDQNDNKIMLNEISEFSPDVLFVGMTCPKQEKWVYLNRKSIKSKYAISIGAVFDWYAGNQKEIAPIWWKLNLGWLIRAANRPEILKRYPNIILFFVHLFITVIRVKKNSK